MTLVWNSFFITEYFVLYHSTLMVILLMPCRGSRVVSHGMAVHSDVFTHRIPFLLTFSLW